jgi:hypothetical protein
MAADDGEHGEVRTNSNHALVPCRRRDCAATESAGDNGQGDTVMVAWDRVTRHDVVRAINEYDKLGPERFYSTHGFAPTTTYELVADKRSYPPKAILGTAYELATGKRLASGDFEGGKSGAVKVLGDLGFTVKEKRRRAG